MESKVEYREKLIKSMDDINLQTFYDIERFGRMNKYASIQALDELEVLCRRLTDGVRGRAILVAELRVEKQYEQQKQEKL